MKCLCFVLALLVCGVAQAQTPYRINYNNPFVIAESKYLNPYHVANPYFVPAPRPAEPQWVMNPFYHPDAPLMLPPRSLFRIIVHDTGAK